MKAEIIVVGTELLMGEVTDINSGFIARELLKIGIGTYYQQTVGDNPTRIQEALELATNRSDLILVCGGIGPTDDDVTKTLVAQHLRVDLVYDDDHRQKILNRAKEVSQVIGDNQLKQALTFDSGITFTNDYGSACGAGHHRQGKTFIVLPGPPFEMQQMFTRYVIPYLQAEFPQKQAIMSKYLMVLGMGEAQVAILLDDLIRVQTNPTIAIYAMHNLVTIRLAASAPTSEEARKLLEHLIAQIQPRLQDHLLAISDQEENMEDLMVAHLKDHQEDLAVQEVGTGGHLMDCLTDPTHAEEVLVYGQVSPLEAGIHTPAQLEKALRELAKSQEATHYLGVVANLDQEDCSEIPLGKGFVGVLDRSGKFSFKSINIARRSKEALKSTFKNEALFFLRQTQLS